MAAAGAGAGAGKPRLVLHLDVNKTIILVDPAGGKSVKTVVNGILADTLWGSVDREAEGGPAWTLKSAELRVGRPPASLVPEVAGAEREPTGGFVGDFCTYHHFIEHVALPYQDVRVVEGAAAKEAAVRHNKAVKAERNARMNAFTEAGGAGEAAADHFADFMGRLLIKPEAKAAECAAASPAFTMDSTGAEGGEAGGDPWAGPKRFIIPAYFHMLRSLHESGRDFVIVFRTFGEDLPVLIDEHNMYCRGAHPLYPDAPRMDGTGGSVDRTVHMPAATGRFVRHADRPGEFASGVNLALQTAGHGVGGGALVDVVSGFRGVASAIEGLLSPSADGGGAPHRTVGLRDHWSWWNVNNESAEAGKLLVVDTADAGVHQIFFDDNVGFADTGMEIVDVRDASSGEMLPYSDAINKYVVKCQPSEALTSDSYFLDRIAACEARRAASGAHK